LSEKATTNIEQSSVVAWQSGVPDVRWYNKNRDVSVFTISTAEELAGLAQIVNGTWGENPARDNFSGKTIRLVANIDLSGYEDWVPIGNYGFDSISVFSGTFDGGGYVISKVNLDRSIAITKALSEGKPVNFNDMARDYQGLFGYIRNGRVENLGLDSVNILGYKYVGGIAGRISDSSIITNSYSTGNVFGHYMAGGLAGLVNMNSSVTNSYSSSRVYGGEAGGGVVGYLDKNSNVTNSYSTGNAKGSNHVGGVVGHVVGNSSVTNSYFAGNIEGYWYIGGVVGGISDSSSIDNCYSTGIINGLSENIGGVVGHVDNHSRVISCYSTSSVSGVAKVGGVAGRVSGKSIVADCAALNPELTGIGISKPIKRVVGVLEDAVLSNNVAYAGIKNNDGYTHWPGDNGADAQNGADLTVAELLADGTLGSRFKGGWTTRNGKLPGLRGEAADFLPYLHKGAQTKMFDTDWYTAKPEAGKFIISTALELAGLAQIVNGTWGGKPYNFSLINITLANDIDLSGYDNWVPIGTYFNKFYGTFDGNGHVIRKLTINRSYTSNQGLFGYIRHGKVKNLGLENVNISGYTDVGAVVGEIEKGGIANCYSTGTVGSFGDRDSYSLVGGIVGRVNESSVTSSYSTATVSGHNYVGGIAGKVYKGSVANSYSTGTVSGKYDVGGIAGGVSDGSVGNSYSIGAVSGKSSVGGIAGKIEYGSRVANCSALNPYVESGNDSKRDFAGRVVGDSRDEEFRISNSISNNAAYIGMKNRFNNTDWPIKGVNKLDGIDITAEEICSGGQLGGGQFTAEKGWTTEKGKLPGLGGKAVEMPEHLFTKLCLE
jgi:hypothetical protein